MVQKVRNFEGVKFPSAFIRGIIARWEQEVIGGKSGFVHFWVASRIEHRDDKDNLDDFCTAFDNVCIEAELSLATATPESSRTTDVPTLVMRYSRYPRPSTSWVVAHPDNAHVDDFIGEIEGHGRDIADQWVRENLQSDRPRVFLGHGQSEPWKALQDYLEASGVAVTSFEAQERAGKWTLGVIDALANESNMAFLVHTAEDEQADRHIRARQNVIHETGFFQGRVGIERAIVVREDGCESFSNIDGLSEIRFAAGDIWECFGRVLAVLRREFPGTEINTPGAAGPAGSVTAPDDRG
jgi:hypothetical protein